MLTTDNSQKKRTFTGYIIKKSFEHYLKIITRREHSQTKLQREIIEENSQDRKH
jgi:hypothetical protein